MCTRRKPSVRAEGSGRSPFSRENERPASGRSSWSFLLLLGLESARTKQVDAQGGRARQAEPGTRLERPYRHPLRRDAARLLTHACPFSGALRSWPISTCTTPFTSFLQRPLRPAVRRPSYLPLGRPFAQTNLQKSHTPWGHPWGSHRPCPLCAPAAAFPPKCHRTPGSSTLTGCREGLDSVSFSILFGPISAMKQKDQRSVRTVRPWK